VASVGGVRLPNGLEWWRDEPGGSAWLERLPQLVADCAERWSLTVGDPFEPAHISLVVPARLPDGTAAVLKLNFPEPESEHEADALAHWRGEGAVRLLADDHERRALLVERCSPGTTLWELPDEEEANRIAAAVLQRLWRPVPHKHPFRLLAHEAARWADEFRMFPIERALRDRGIAYARDLASTQEDLVLLHQDFHGGNVLRAEREPWLAIDPKPLVGERAFDAASLLRDRRDELTSDPRPRRRLRRRLDQLAADLGLDRERMRGWGIVHALAWGVSGDGKVEEDMVACARWLSESAARPPAGGSKRDR
jgi:streptomycin 6-kinase